VSIFLVSLLWLIFTGSSGSAKKSGDDELKSVRAARVVSARRQTGNLLPTASVIQVNSTAQSPGTLGDCTLGEAIQAANTDTPVDGCSAGSGVDTIILPAGTYTLVASDAVTPGTGLPAITSDVVIQGAGSAMTIIERNANAIDQFRLMAVTSPNAGSLVLNDITMRGGRSADVGGALQLSRASTFNNVIFIDNRAPNGGGAIFGPDFGDSRPVTLNNCTFDNNRATNYYGGAVYSPIVTASNSTFTNNQAAVGGGAIFYNQSGGARFTITDSTFTNNQAANNGGAIMGSGQATIAGSLFDSNSAGSEGGAISFGLDLDIRNSVVTNNHANEKGGIAREPVTTALGGGSESLTIDNCNISGNTSNRTAGGVFIESGSGTISNSTISANTAGLEGGGIFDRDALLNLANDTIDGNTATNGGGVYFQEGSDAKPLTINNATITGNHASNAGGGFFRYSGIVNFKNSILALNVSDTNFAHDLYGVSEQTHLVTT
jgi:predicted outer membrane repeat protein